MLKYISSKFFESLIKLNYTLGCGSGRACSVEDVEEYPENLEMIDTGSSHRLVNQAKIDPMREIALFFRHRR